MTTTQKDRQYNDHKKKDTNNDHIKRTEGQTIQ